MSDSKKLIWGNLIFRPSLKRLLVRKDVLTAYAGQLEGVAKTNIAVRYILVSLTLFIMTGTAADAIYANFNYKINHFDVVLEVSNSEQSKLAAEWTKL